MLNLPAPVDRSVERRSRRPDLATPADATSTRPAVAPAVLDAQLRDRLNRIPAAFRPEPEPWLARSLGTPLGYADFTAAEAG